jgi:hypothetical protein
MATRSSRGSGSKSERDQKQQEREQKDREQQGFSLLDNPSNPEEASPIRGWAYFAAILAVALLVNLVALVMVSGGR